MQVLSRKLTQRYFRGSHYMETDIEVGSSVAAESVVSKFFTRTERGSCCFRLFRLGAKAPFHSSSDIHHEAGVKPSPLDPYRRHRQQLNAGSPREPLRPEIQVGVCLTEPAVLDVGFFLEGGHRVLGCVRVNNLKLSVAEPLLLLDSTPPPPPPPPREVRFFPLGEPDFCCVMDESGDVHFWSR